MKLRRFVAEFVNDYKEKPMIYLARLSSELSSCEKAVETKLVKVMSPAGLAFSGEEFFPPRRQRNTPCAAGLKSSLLPLLRKWSTLLMKRPR